MAATGITVEEIEGFIADEVANLTGVDGSSINSGTALIGTGRVLDSADLVVLLLAIEDLVRDRLEVAWDWTSDSAMSEARSVLRTVGSLASHVGALSRD
jgi:acyl carrier protein